MTDLLNLSKWLLNNIPMSKVIASYSNAFTAATPVSPAICIRLIPCIRKKAVGGYWGGTQIKQLAKLDLSILCKSEIDQC